MYTTTLDTFRIKQQELQREADAQRLVRTAALRQTREGKQMVWILRWHKIDR